MLLLLWLLACTSPDPADTSEPAALVDCDALAVLPDGVPHTFYETNPTYADPDVAPAPWVAGEPADAGMDSAGVEAALAELQDLPFVSSFLVLRRGVLVAEHYLHGAEAHHSANVHSASKSLLGLTVGAAVARGELSVDQPLAELLDVPTDDPRKAGITVEHLLTMTSGLAWTEDSTEYTLESEDDWVAAILDLPLAADPGTRFHYSTGDTHLLSAALGVAAGHSLCELAHADILGPIGAEAEHWGRDPQGVSSGGYNVYLTPEELLRLGVLQLQGGSWEGEQLVPEAWAAEAVRPHEDAGGGWSYGRLWWLTTVRGHDTWVAWGWGGQLVYVLPDLDLVVVITTNTRDYAPDYDGIPLLRRHLVPACAG